MSFTGIKSAFQLCILLLKTLTLPIMDFRMVETDFVQPALVRCFAGAGPVLSRRWSAA